MGENNQHHGGDDTPYRIQSSFGSGSGREQVFMTSTEDDADQNDGEQGSHFEDRGELLEDTGPLDSDVVQDSEQKNDSERDDDPGDFIKGDKIAEVIRDDQSQASGGACPDDEQLSPSEYESGIGSEASTDVDVFPARVRHSCSEFSVDQPADKHKEAAQKPENDDRVEGTEIAGDDLRCGIDSSTYHDPDQDGDPVKNTQSFAERWL